MIVAISRLFESRKEGELLLKMIQFLKLHYLDFLYLSYLMAKTTKRLSLRQV